MIFEIGYTRSLTERKRGNNNNNNKKKKNKTKACLKDGWPVIRLFPSRFLIFPLGLCCFACFPLFIYLFLSFRHAQGTQSLSYKNNSRASHVYIYTYIYLKVSYTRLHSYYIHAGVFFYFVVFSRARFSQLVRDRGVVSS